MKLKDKIKVGIITGVTTLLSSCGFSNSEEPKVEERNDNTPAMGFPVVESISMGSTTEAGDEFLGIKLSNETEHVYNNNINWDKSSIKGDSASTQILNELSKAKIPVTKGDSILHDVEIEGDFNGNLKITNPHYVLNKVEKKIEPNNSERIGNIEINRKVDPNDIESKTYKVDDKTIGVKNWHDEEIQKKFTEVRKLVQNKEAEKKLHKGDTVKIHDFPIFGHQHIKKQAIVKEDGISPTEDIDVVKHDQITKVVFDYKVKIND